MSVTRTPLTCAAAVLTCSMLAVPAWAQGYAFTRIAHTTGGAGYSTLQEGPTLNEANSAVFGATKSAGVAVYRWVAGTTTTVLPPGLGYSALSNPSQNEAGNVAVRGEYPGTPLRRDILFCAAGGPCPVVALAGPGQAFSDFSGVHLSNLDKVAFSFLAPGGGGVRVIETNGATYFNADWMQGFVAPYGGLTSNNQPAVFFRMGTGAGAQSLSRHLGGVTTTLADTLGPYANFGGDAGTIASNDSGQVVYLANLDAGGSAIYRYSAGVHEKVAETGATFQSLDGQALNSVGDVIFLATLVAGGQGLHLFSSGTVTEIIRTGAALDGSTVLGLTRPRRQSLTSDKRFVLWAQLSDGRQGIYLAVPSVPVPTSRGATVILGLLLLCLGAVLSRTNASRDRRPV